MSKNQTINEFSTQIKENGVDNRIVNITPSLVIDDDLQDILDFLREYRDRVLWENMVLIQWLEKHNFINEFREYYENI